MSKTGRQKNICHVVGQITKREQLGNTNGFSLTKYWLTVPRNSGVSDEVPVFLKRPISDSHQYDVGAFADVKGRFSSFVKTVNGNTIVEHYIYCTSIEVADKAESLKNPVGTNYVCVCGNYKANGSEIKETYSGRRVLEYLLFSDSNTIHNGTSRADRVPCVAWNDTAEKIFNLGENSVIQSTGRFQSRAKTSRTFYELSVQSVEILVDRQKNLQNDMKNYVFSCAYI